MSDKDRSTPYISKELYEWLIKQYPERSPDRHESQQDLWARAGQAEVTRKLKHLHESQSE